VVLFASHLLLLLLVPFRMRRDKALSLLHLVFVSALLTSESLPFSTGMEIVVSVVVLVPALAFLLYIALERLHAKCPIACMATFFPGPSVSSSSTAAVAAPPLDL
jgi:hypothetical protein